MLAGDCRACKRENLHSPMRKRHTVVGFVMCAENPPRHSLHDQFKSYHEGTHHMKRSQQQAAITAVMLAALGLPAQQAAATPQDLQIYGQVRLSINNLKSGAAGSYMEERDNASRLGFKGKEDLGGGLTAMFGLEMGLDADTGSQTTPAYRNSYVALRGGFGTIAMGRLDSANPTGSPLYSQVTAITSFAANDAGATAIGTSILNARNRTSNSLGYMSPTWNGFNMRGRFYLRGDTAAGARENDARSLDLGLNYANGPLKAAVGYAKDSRSGGLADNEFSSKWQTAASYDFGLVEPYVLIGRDRYQNKPGISRENVDYWLAGIKLEQNQHSFVLNVMQRDVQANLQGERKRWQMAYMYQLSKRTQLQVFMDRDGVDSSRSNARVRAVGAGIRHDF